MDISTMSTTVVAIVIITYLIGMAGKVIKFIKDEWIPVIVGVSGGILGVIGMHVIPEFPAQDWMNALSIGIVSGLASTGINQIGKQLLTKREVKEDI